MNAEEAPDLGLRDLDLDIAYDSVEDALGRFYVPCLERAVRYDRSVGYFRASSLAVAARGMSRFIAGGGQVRLLVGAEVGEDERDALVGAVEIPDDLARRLASELVPANEIERHRLEVLAWLAQEGRLEVRVAVPVDASGVPVSASQAVPYFHEKIGVLRDRAGDGVAFQGSTNETARAWVANFESFAVFTSWGDVGDRFDHYAARFEKRWRGDVEGFRVLPFPEAARRQLLALAPQEEPLPRDVEEVAAAADPGTLAHFLSVAPRLVDGVELAEATSGVSLFPHQRKVVERLAGQYPRSWLVADEVGLGKTISAGLALRRLLLRGEVRRVLVLAPANVCRQWQDELFEKLGLWVPRLEGTKRHGVHPDDVTDLDPGSNPYAEDAVLLVSSHLARRPQHRRLLAAAPPYDLLIVDEAHHARRRAADPDEYRPSQLLTLLDQFRDLGQAAATWLLTATPMQVHAIELCDLLGHVGLRGALAQWPNFERFYAELTKDDEHTDWGFLDRMLRQTPRAPLGTAELALLDQVGQGMGPVARSRISRFGTEASEGVAVANGLDQLGRAMLRRWIRQLGPVGQHVTRHTRQTLKGYAEQGLITESVADREVAAVAIPMTANEKALYDELDDFIDRLTAAHGTKQGVGFILTVYRRRLTSSWAAIRATLGRRVERERHRLVRGSVLAADDVVDDVDDDEPAVDDQIIPLTEEDLADLGSYLQRLEGVDDSKFDQLVRDLDQVRGAGDLVLVFTQFTDTLDDLRDRLAPRYRSHLATFTGAGGAQWREESWEAVSKQELVEAMRARRVQVVLATDAASEGLNLQVASALINYDLPWNPMRIEQRIGRIDRLGQEAPTIHIRNYVVPGTVEEDVYAALGARIDIFCGVIGQLQPILGATEAVFRRIFRAPRSERETVEGSAIADLVDQLDQLRRSGVDLGGDDDPLPDPPRSTPPVDLDALQTCLVELDVTLDEPGRPTTGDPSRASRDAGRWAALATFGHPALGPALDARAVVDDGSSLVVREMGSSAVAYRADRTPPTRVRTLDDLVDLGPAVALGDADEWGRREVAEHHETVVARRHQAEAHVAERRDGQRRQRFRQLVHEVVDAESVLAQRSGEGAGEPLIVWTSIRSDASSGWRNADPWREYFGFGGPLGMAGLLPERPAADDGRTDAELRAVRRRSGLELTELLQEVSADG